MENKNPFRFGDHIKVRRMYGLYSHHGVYIGNNNVLHLTGDAKRGLPLVSYGEGKASVQIDDLQYFENGSKSLIVEKVCKDMDKTLFIQEVNKIINKDENYNLALHNCEHFANEITKNESSSQQIQSAWYASGLGGLSSMVGIYTLHTLTGSVFIPILITSLSFVGLQYL